MPPVISIIGKSKSGKTTLIEKLIPELRRRGFRIGVIKHAFHAFEIDKKGKDSWRHKAAGAEKVVVSSPRFVTMVKDFEGEDLDALVNYFSDVDLVITEGFKKEKKPQIEVFRNAQHQSPLPMTNQNLIAMVTDSKLRLNVPTFGLDDITELSDLIEKTYLQPSKPRSRKWMD